MGFVLMSHLSASILHLQINVSHYAMDTSFVECDEHFAAKALRTTMDVSCPPWLDFFHGGLQFQVIHHLFPRVPRHNLRKLKPLVVQFCKDTGLEYLEYGFIEGQMIVIAQLRVRIRLNSYTDLPSFLVVDRSITVYLHSLTPHGTSLTIISSLPPSLPPSLPQPNIDTMQVLANHCWLLMSSAGEKIHI
jgi:hypothetical protein